MTAPMGLAAAAALLATISLVATQADPGFRDLRWQEIAQRRAASGRPWLEFLRSSALYAGNYSLARGASDHQAPHPEDEVYYVVAGRARFTAGTDDRARTVDAEPGAVLFVAAGVPHRFHDVTEDLELLVFFSTAAPPPAREEVAAVLERYEQAYNRRDAAALARVYTEDGLFVPPSGEIVRGREALEAYWSRGLSRTLELELLDFEARGGIGWASGTWRFPAAEGAPERGGRFVVGLRRDRDGVWRVSVDTYNQPAAR